MEKATRRNAREWAVQMLTAADLNPPDDLQAMAATFWSDLVEEGRPSQSLRAFAEARFFGVMEKLTEIDGILIARLENWSLDRLGTVERAVLRMAIWEMTWSDVPKPVVINEAVDIANWFSSPKTRSIVNGTLDRYAKSLK